MNNQMSYAEVGQSWMPSRDRWSPGLRAQPVLLPIRPDGPGDMPVMSATMLGLDLLFQESSIDLRMASELVLSDVGATLQVLQSISDEFGGLEDRPSRMDECLASLDVYEWFSRVSAKTFASGREQTKTTALWKHCRLVAQYSQLVAESLQDVSPEQAYLVGLLHEIEKIPEALGWDNGISNSFAMEGVLPLFVQEALTSMKQNGPSAWKFVVTAAHDLAGADFDSSMLPNGRFTGTCSL